MNKKKLAGAGLALVLAFSLVLAGCGGSGGTGAPPADGSAAAPAGNDASGASGAGTQPADGGAKDTLIMASPTDIDSMDVQYNSSLISMKICTQLFDGLVRADAEGNITPWLAESWEEVDDGLGYIFHLKQGVKFHNGEELKASDVVFTVNRGKESPFAGSVYGPIEGAEAIDEYTVKYILKYRYAPFIASMSVPIASIVSEKGVTDAGEEFNRNPVGTGAYKCVSWEPGDKVTLEAFGDWHGGEVPIKNLIFRVLADPTTSVIALEKGEVDLLLEPPATDRDNILANQSLALYETASMRHHYIGFNTEAGTFADVKVRQAVAQAVDRAGITTAATEGLGIVAQNHLSPSQFGFPADVTWYEQNVDAAKALLAEAGVGSGFTCRVIAQDGVAKKIAQVMQENLTPLGITCNIEILERAGLVDRAQKGDFDIVINTWSAPVADADYSLAFLFNSSMIGAMNHTRFNNAQCDELIKQGQAELAPDKRKEVYKELCTLLKDEVPSVPIFFESVMLAADKDLKNVVPNPSSTYYFYDYSW